MPQFTIRVRATNNSGFPVKVHIGASLVGQKDTVEYYNTSDDITRVLNLEKMNSSDISTPIWGKPKNMICMWCSGKVRKPSGRAKDMRR